MQFTPFLYLTLLEEDRGLAERAHELLAWNGGGTNSSVTGVVNVDSQGNVHPDQFFQTFTQGNVRERSSGNIRSRLLLIR